MNNKSALFSSFRELIPNRLRNRIILLFFLSGLIGHFNIIIAQDLIILKNGDEIKSAVIEVGPDLIKYKKFENQTGPVYAMDKNRVFMIKYANGTKDIFTNSPETQQKTTQRAVPETSSIANRKPLAVSGAKVYLDRQKLRPHEVRNLMASYPDALHSYKSGRALYGWDVAIAIIGIGVFAVTNDDAGFWTACAAGAPFWILDLILYNIADKRVNASVSLYNNYINRQVSYNINFGTQKNGIGFAINF